MPWTSGAGYQVTHPGLNSGTIVNLAGMIDLGERGIWSGIKQHMSGAVKLFGNTDTIQSIRVQVPGDMAVTVATAGDALQTLTITTPAGTTSTAPSKITRVVGPNLQPNNVDGNAKVVVIELGNLANGDAAVIDLSGAA